MSLVTREMAAQNGHNHSRNQVNGTSNQQSPDGEADHTNQIVPFADGEPSREYNAPSSSFSIPKHNGGIQDRAAGGAGGLADFFSSEVFQIVLHNPTTAHRLLKFSQARMCGENMEFLEKVRHEPDLVRQ